MTHRHEFEKYEAAGDRWLCLCGASADRSGKVTDPNAGRIAIRYVKQWDIQPDPVRTGAALDLTSVTRSIVRGAFCKHGRPWMKTCGVCEETAAADAATAIAIKNDVEDLTRLFVSMGGEKRLGIRLVYLGQEAE